MPINVFVASHPIESVTAIKHMKSTKSIHSGGVSSGNVAEAPGKLRPRGPSSSCGCLGVSAHCSQHSELVVIVLKAALM